MIEWMGQLKPLAPALFVSGYFLVMFAIFNLRILTRGMPIDAENNTAMPADFHWSEFAPEWTLDPGITYLNHGSFGPPADTVRRERERWSEALCRNPMDFYLRRMEDELDTASDRLGKFVGCRGEDLVFVPNATTAMNIVAATRDAGSMDKAVSDDRP